MSEPLRIELMDNMDFFIKINNLKEVTNPIYLQKNVPTPDGLLSYEIFGISTFDRKTRMAYIDLKGHYMSPLAAKKLKAYDRRLESILYSNEKYILKDGDLVKDEENGNTGPEYLYNIWGKVKVKEKTTITTKEIETFFKQDRNELFITKLPVVPAFYRDINDINNSTKSTLEINSKYSSIISYCQNMESYTDTFSMMKYLTQARVQTLLVNIYETFVIEKIKGQPSKYGMLRRFYMSKNIDYSARMVISSSILQTGSPESMGVRYSYSGLPLAYTCACFYPFIEHALTKFFESEFISGGKYPIYKENGEIDQYVTIKEAPDTDYINHIIEKFIHSPSTRFDKIPIPDNEEGITGKYMFLTGRFQKDNTTFSRPMTVTDLLYIVANDVVQNKHIYVTRFPLANYNGQFCSKIHITTTMRTKPVMIGDRIYTHYPIIEGRPHNAFFDTLQMPNGFLDEMGADFDGDTVSVKPVFSIEGNEDCERHMNSKLYYLNSFGKSVRPITMDFILTAYRLTKHSTNLPDGNVVKPKYTI